MTGVQTCALPISLASTLVQERLRRQSLAEELRVLYVAMTRAKDDLHLVVPQRFFAHGQHSQGDRHVYASRTRFIPEKLLGLFERTNWPMVPSGATARGSSQGPRIDIGARMRGMWR